MQYIVKYIQDSFPASVLNFQRCHSDCSCHFQKFFTCFFFCHIKVWPSLQETVNGWGQSDADESLPFFTLSDLWDSFKECNAYGTVVPLVLNSCSDGVVQYYVPYLSAIQLYGGFRRHIGPLR